jgi:hypothetical protein
MPCLAGDYAGAREELSLVAATLQRTIRGRVRELLVLLIHDQKRADSIEAAAGATAPQVPQ